MFFIDILVNGRPTGGWVQPQRGVRQGCPLAPMLFVIAADALARCVFSACHAHMLSGFSAGQGRDPMIPLLQYADDTIFFLEGSAESARRAAILVELFGEVSGMKINHSKSSFIPFGMSEVVASNCAHELRTPAGSLPITYLGLPLSDHHIGSTGWTPVVERMERRLQGWSSRLLSRGGRLILLRTVLSALPIYYLSILKMPVQVERCIDTIQSNFLWRGPDT